MADSKHPEDSSRDRMFEEIAEGQQDVSALDFSEQSILVRGCDPRMALRAAKIMPQQLGNPLFVSCTDDDDFISKLKEREWSVVFFAPGACRYNAANMPIPGGRARTKGWGLVQYRVLVREHQGEDIQIVETTEEREIIPRLLQALFRSNDTTQ